MKVWKRLKLFSQFRIGNAFLRNLVFLLILVLGFGIRIFDLKDPPLDFFASRQLRSALIARATYYKLNSHADPILRQKAIQLADLEIYEPPILEDLVGLTDYLIGNEYFWIGRIYNSLFWCIGGFLLYLIGRRYASSRAAMTGLAFYLFLPFSVVASRSFQPDPWMVLWILFAGYSILRWSEQTERWKWAFWAGVAGGVALIVKVFSAFFIAPIFACVIISSLGIRNVFRNLKPWVMGVLAVAPSLVYYLGFNTQRSSDFFSFWVVSLSGLILTTKFYVEWLAMIRGLMGLTIVLAAFLGLLLAKGSFKPMLIGGWIGYGWFGLTFPYQYETHEYYHLALIPLVALSIIPLLGGFFQALKNQALIWRLAATGILICASFYGFYVARSTLIAASYEMEPASWQRVGNSIPEGKPFIALTADYGMRLSYYGWRNAGSYWPSTADLNLFSLSGNDPLSYDKYFNEVTSGKDYFLVTALSELDAQPQLKALLEKNFPIYLLGNGFLVYDLIHRLKP